MHLLRLLIRTLSVLLLGAFGTAATLAAPVDWSQIRYPVMAQELSAQPVNLTNAARAPPHTSAIVMATGAALAHTSFLRALDGVEPTGVVYALLSSSIAPNRTPRTVGNLQGGPLENATQVSGRFNLESGPPNGTVFRADNQGNITSYATYDANGQILTRVDVTGAAHNGIPTPHVLEYGRNTLPDGSVRVQTPRADPRPASPDEIP